MNLKEQIREKGFRFSWIAEQVGCKPSIFSLYLSGDRNMPDDIKKKIKEIIK